MRDRAVELGVPLLGTRKKNVISAAAFLAALERDASGDETARGPADPAAALRERLGLRLVGGGA